MITTADRYYATANFTTLLGLGHFWNIYTITFLFRTILDDSRVRPRLGV